MKHFNVSIAILIQTAYKFVFFIVTEQTVLPPSHGIRMRFLPACECLGHFWMSCFRVQRLSSFPLHKRSAPYKHGSLSVTHSAVSLLFSDPNYTQEGFFLKLYAPLVLSVTMG